MFNKIQKGSIEMMFIISILIIVVIITLISTLYNSFNYKENYKNEFLYITDVLRKSKSLNCKDSSFVDSQIDLYTNIKYTNYLTNMNRFLLCNGVISLKYTNNDVLNELKDEDMDVISLLILTKRIEKKDKSFKSYYLNKYENEIDYKTCLSDINECSVVFVIK